MLRVSYPEGKKEDHQWTQRTITLSPPKRGIYIFTKKVADELPELKDVKCGVVNLFLRNTTGASGAVGLWFSAWLSSDILLRRAPRVQKEAIATINILSSTLN